jgi:glutamine amidotransferase
LIVIVDYHTCNTGSILNMLRRIGAQAIVAEHPEQIEQARKIILPGIGAFDAGMANLKELGFVEPLRRKALDQRIPTLGICLGAQLLLDRSEEGDQPGLGWIPGVARRFRFEAGSPLKVPHMGWNRIETHLEHPLFSRYDTPPRYYFVHSYYMDCANQEHALGWTSYGIRFASSIVRNNIMGVQFHPEKSHRFGMQLLKNFVELCD